MPLTTPPGTYEATSRNIKVTAAEEGRIVLSAECRKVDGTWVKSELKYDIANCNGVLKWAPNGC
ncbi:MAG: CVNH domain-containing protein [Terracidiphilus sp.]